MSSPGLQTLHSVPAHPSSHAKRPFDECGSDHAMPTGTSSSSRRTTSANDARTKRARSTSSAGTDSPASAYNTAPSTSDASDAPLDVPMVDPALPPPPPPPPPPPQHDSLRTSLERFEEFDRHIAALRTSLAATHAPPPPWPAHPAPDGPSPPYRYPPLAAQAHAAPVIHPSATEPPARHPPDSVPDEIRARYRHPDTRSHRPRTDAPDSPTPRAPPLADRARVIREHLVDRDAVPSLFDVFSLAGVDRSQPSLRYTEPVPPRVPASHSERSRGPTPIMLAAPPEPPSRLRSSWAFIPSSNSLMSESASERRQALALERFRARLRRSSFDGDDESDSRWSGSDPDRDSALDLSISSPIPPSPNERPPSHFPPLGARPPPPTTTSTMTSFQLEDFLAEQREEAPEVLMLGWDAPRTAEHDRQQREYERRFDRERHPDRVCPVWEWDRQRDRPNQDVRGRTFPSGSSLASTSSAREESSLASIPPSALSRSSLGQLGAPSTASTSNTATSTATNGSQHYSYSNLNLSSFQSGLFRDSLRRNAEVDTSNPPAITSATTVESRSVSRLDDSGSDMDQDDVVRRRPPSPEWSRPQPYAGRTPPPDYSPPPRDFSFSLRPGFSVLRRGSMVSYDPPRSQNANRNSMIFPRPAPLAPSAPARPSSYESNTRPAPPERTERDRFLPARIFESLYRSHDEGRRGASSGTGQAYVPHPSNQHHALTPGSGAVSRNDRGDVGRDASASGNSRPGTEVGERRTLGLGGTLRSRLARLASPQSASSTLTSPSRRQRSPPHPIGARPQVEAHRRASSGTNLLEHERGAGPLNWAGVEVPPREVPWRGVSGPRHSFVAPASAGPARAEAGEPVRAEEQRSRLRSLRQRLSVRPVLRGVGRRGNMGDYVPDELFDDSYEALLSLSNMLGEVRSRATPDEVIASLPTGTFKEWKRDDSESRCPICLDDYQPLDVVMKLIECPHWLHKHCLEQWLRTANTCPVCREKVKVSPKPAPAKRRPHRDVSGPSGTSSSAGASGRFPLPSAPANGWRSLEATVSEPVVDDRDMGTEPWSAPLRESQTFSGPRPPAHTHELQEAYVPPPFPPPHGLPYRLRVPPAQPISSIRPAVGTTEGPDRSFGFVPPLLRDQGSDSSMSTGSSGNGVNRRSMAGASGGPLFVDAQTTRRESLFAFVPPSSGFVGGSSAAPLQPPGYGGHAPPVVISSSTEAPRDWRSATARFNMDASRSSSSSSSVSGAPSRPLSMANRIPVEEDSPFEEFTFTWHGRRGRARPAFPFQEEPTRRGDAS